MNNEVNWWFVGSMGVLLTHQRSASREEADNARHDHWAFVQVLEYPEKTVVIYRDPHSVATYPNLDTAKVAMVLRGVLRDAG